MLGFSRSCACRGGHTACRLSKKRTSQLFDARELSRAELFAIMANDHSPLVRTASMGANVTTACERHHVSVSADHSAIPVHPAYREPPAPTLHTQILYLQAAAEKSTKRASLEPHLGALR